MDELWVAFVVVFMCLGIAGFDDDVKPEHYQAAEILCEKNDGVKVINGHGFFGRFEKSVECQNGASFRDIASSLEDQ